MNFDEIQWETRSKRALNWILNSSETEVFDIIICNNENLTISKIQFGYKTKWILWQTENGIYVYTFYKFNQIKYVLFSRV